MRHGYTNNGRNSRIMKRNVYQASTNVALLVNWNSVNSGAIHLGQVEVNSAIFIPPDDVTYYTMTDFALLCP